MSKTKVAPKVRKPPTVAPESLGIEALRDLRDLLLGLRAEQIEMRKALSAPVAKPVAEASVLPALLTAVGGLDLVPGQMEAITALLQTHLGKRP